MTTFQQPCPSCQRALELPYSALGKQAKCPACQAVFEANGPTETTQPSPEPNQDVFAAAGFPSDSRSGSASGPASPAANPYTQPANEAVSPSTNPYAPSTMAYTAKPTAMQVREVGFDEIWSSGWAVFKERWGPVVGAFALATIGSFFLSLIANLVGGVVAAGNQEIGGVLAGGLSLLTNLVTQYFSFGCTCVAIAAARNEASPFSRICPPIMAFLRYALGFILLFVVIGVLVGLMVGASYLVSQTAGNDDLFVILGIVSGMVCLGALLLSMWLFWSFVMITADNRTTFREAVRLSYSVTLQNKVTSLLLLVVATMLSIGGLLACYFGLFFTIPLSSVIFACGYLLMTSQPVAVPMQQAYSPPNYPNPNF